MDQMSSSQEDHLDLITAYPCLKFSHLVVIFLDLHP